MCDSLRSSRWQTLVGVVNIDAVVLGSMQTSGIVTDSLIMKLILNQNNIGLQCMEFDLNQHYFTNHDVLIDCPKELHF